MNIFLIGPSGSGKDTQASLISKEFSLRWVSFGQIMRNRSLVNDEIGHHIAATLASGHLVEWNYIADVIRDELSKNSKNYVWTGFPRKADQADIFDKLVLEFSPESQVEMVINLVVSEDIAKQRIHFRKSTNENVREDDKNDESIRQRLAWYSENIQALKEHYQKQGKYFEVNGEADVNIVFDDIKQLIYNFSQ